MAIPMGYDLHIIRKACWTDDEGPVITAEEWLAIVDADSDLRLAGYNGPYFALWLADPAGKAWLDWSRRGEIMAKNPRPPLIQKMIEIAARLGAQVQGDDRETYHPGGVVKQEDGSVQTNYNWQTWDDPAKA